MKRPRGGNPQQRFGKTNFAVLYVPWSLWRTHYLFPTPWLQQTVKQTRLAVYFLSLNLYAHIFNVKSVIFISCKAPVDPVELVVKYIKSVENTGVSRTRCVYLLERELISYIHRNL